MNSSHKSSIWFLAFATLAVLSSCQEQAATSPSDPQGSVTPSANGYLYAADRLPVENAVVHFANASPTCTTKADGSFALPAPSGTRSAGAPIAPDSIWFTAKESGELLLRDTITLPIRDSARRFLAARLPGVDSEGLAMDSRDRRLYRFVRIGSTWWFAENLAYVTETSIIPTTRYGRLYAWNESTSQSRQGICPQGWQIPTNSDWDSLAAIAKAKGYEAGQALKSRTSWGNGTILRTTGSSIITGTGSDLFGFNALPAVDRAWLTYLQDYSLTRMTAWWSSDEVNQAEAMAVSLSSDNQSMSRFQMAKSARMAIRCIRR